MHRIGTLWSTKDKTMELNTTMKNLVQNSTAETRQQHSQSVFYTKILSTIYSLGAIGNLLIIIYFIKINQKKLLKMSAYHFLIINLAISLIS